MPPGRKRGDRFHPPPEKRALKELAKTPECERFDIGWKDIRSAWSELFVVKAEATSLFG